MPATTENAVDVEIATSGENLPAVVPPREQRRFISGNLAKAETMFAHYPESVREDCLWLHAYTWRHLNKEHALLHKLAKSLGIDVSANYWYQVITGRYFQSGGDAKALKGYIERIKAEARKKEETGAIAFIENETWRRIRDYIDTRRAPDSVCRFGAIEGSTGCGKSWCLKHYAALNNHLRTVYLRAPARASRARIVHKLARSYMIPYEGNSARKEYLIEEIVSPDRCILIDDAQDLFSTHHDLEHQPVFTYLHELQEETGCTIIFSWVPTFRRTIESQSEFWAQFMGRIGGPEKILTLKQEPLRKDLLKFAAAFGVADDAAALPILRKWAGTRWGLRVLADRLRDARLLATKRRSREILVAHLEAIDCEPIRQPEADSDEGSES
jgi:hypothetical protein